MKNSSAIRLLLSANFISGIAQGLSMIAIPLYFNQVGMSNWYGVGYVIITCISLFWSTYTGTLVDRYNRKYIFICLNIICGLLLTSIAFTGYWQGYLPPYVVIGVFGMTFLNYNLHYPAFYAFMQEITEPEYYNRTASIIEVQSQLAAALAGGVAAVLLEDRDWGWIQIQKWEIYEIFALDAATYFIALLLILFMKFDPIAIRQKELGSTWQRLKIGIQYLFREKSVFIFGMASYAVFIVVLLFVFYLSPLYVSNHLEMSDAVFAQAELYYAMGAILAGLCISWVFSKSTYVGAIIILTLITVTEFGLLTFSKSAYIYWIMSFLLGITNAGIRVIRVSYLFKRIPNQVIGRANSIFSVVGILFRILFSGIFALPFFHQNNHVIWTLFILTCFMLSAALVLIIFYRQLSIGRLNQKD